MDTQVAIIGGGPCGLMTGLLLARFGIKCTVVEKHPDISFHPKAMGVTRRTAEIYRQLGILDTMMTEDIHPSVNAVSIWSKGLAGELLGQVPMPAEPAGFTPCRRFHCPQPHTEDILLEALNNEPLADVRYHTLVDAFRDTGDGVELYLIDRDTGTSQTLRAEWLVAADGAESPTRRSLGIETEGPGDMGHFLNVYFRADYGPHLEGRRAILHQSLQEDSFGFFVAVNGTDHWLMHQYLDVGEAPEDFSREQLHDMVVAASGLPNVPVEIISVSPWVMSPKVASQWRKGRCFVTGDASARLSPAGGLGMNTGIASAHNLAWKLAAVVKGEAGESLLDTYEAERLPAAKATFSASLGNAQEVTQIVEAGLMGEWDRARELIGHSRRAGSGMGMDLGHVYDVGALVPGEHEAPVPAEPVNAYVPTARPGARAPHLEILVDGENASTLDFYGREFCLLSGSQGEGWCPALKDALASLGTGLKAKCLVSGRDFTAEGHAFTELYGISDDGAVLVRPDGVVAARWPSFEPEALTHALRQVLCLS